MLRRVFISLAMVWSVLSAPVLSEPDEPFRAAEDRPADIQHIKLEFKVDIPNKTVLGMATIDLTALRDLNSIRFDAVDFRVARVTLARGEAAPIAVDYVNDGESIELHLGDVPLAENQRATVAIEYEIRNPSAGLNFFGPSKAEPDVPYVVWSQGESVTNRYWVPCFDHPNEMQTTEMIVTAAAGNEVVSNGHLVSKKKNADGTVTFHWLQDKPHVSYLITMIVGEFHSETETWHGKPVVYNVPAKYRGDVKRSFGNTLRMLDLFSELTGVEYPWDKYTQTCAFGFGGGMENTSATTLGTSTLHDQRAHLDFSSDGLVAHELAHQWFGDFVTCKDWSHLWLNEGFASYMDPAWTEHDLGRDEYEYQIYRSMQRAKSGGKKRPVVDRHYAHSRDMFDSRAYPKGASILHMLRHRVGTDDFWKSVNYYLTTHAHQPVETSDLRQAFEKVSGRSLERFFFDWLERPGHPELDVKFSWNEEDKLAELTVKQTQDADAFHFPFEVEFRFENGDPILFSKTIQEKERRFYVPLPEHPSMVLVDPSDAVLSELKEHKGRSLWKAQLLHAPKVTSRMRAAKHFGDGSGDQDTELLAEALKSEKFWGVGVSIAKALGEAGGDLARDALLEGLRLDHPKVRSACAGELGSFYKDGKVIDALYELIQKSDPSYRVQSSAIRSYGKIQPEGAVAFLTSLLSRDSHREQIRSSALRALGNQKDAAAIETMLAWIQPGKPRSCRMAATSGLGTLVENVNLADEQVEKIALAVAEQIRGEQRWVKQGAMRTLSSMGAAAKVALPILRDVEANDALRRVRKSAKDAIKKITSSAPEKEQLIEFREELQKIQAENKKMKTRLEKLEAGR